MKQAGRGFSMIELIIALAVLGVLLALAAPSFNAWISNTKIRTAAEVIQSGLQLARAEAVRRNALISFQLTSSTGGDCTLATTATSWVITYGTDDPTGKCDVALLNEAYPVTDTTHNPVPRIIQARTAGEGSNNVLAAADQSVIAFNGLGRVTNPSTNPIVINLQNATVGCQTTSNKAPPLLRCLRVTASIGGQIRICDPILPGTDPQAC